MFIYIEKLFEKIQHLFMRQILSKLGTKGNFFKLIKGNYETPRTRDEETDQDACSQHLLNLVSGSSSV